MSTTEVKNQSMYQMMCLLIEATQLQRQADTARDEKDFNQVKDLEKLADELLQQVDNLAREELPLAVTCTWSKVLEAYSLTPNVAYQQ